MMEQGHDPRTSAAPGSISPCREFASATLGEGGLCIYGAVRLLESRTNTRSDLDYDQNASTIWVLGSRKRNFLGD